MTIRNSGAILIAFAVAGASAEAQQQPVDESAILNLHNAERQNVNPPATTPIPNLTWSADLAQSAAAYAAQCNFQHSGAPEVGENLFVSSSSVLVPPDDVVVSWASEQTDYDIETNTCAEGKQCGHYTQIIWSNTDFVGCGAALCDPKIDGQWGQIWVCQYSAQGNIPGEAPYDPDLTTPPPPVETRPVPLAVFCRHVHKWAAAFTLGAFLENGDSVCSDPPEGAELTVAGYCEHLHTWGGNNTTWVADSASYTFCEDNKSKPTTKIDKKLFCEHLHQYAASNTTWPYYTDDPDAYTPPWEWMGEGFCAPPF